MSRQLRIAVMFSHTAAAAGRFDALYGQRFKTVAEYADCNKNQVEIVDLREIVPAFSAW